MLVGSVVGMKSRATGQRQGEEAERGRRARGGEDEAGAGREGRREEEGESRGAWAARQEREGNPGGETRFRITVGGG